MNAPLAPLTWPIDKAGLALEALARASGLVAQPHEIPPVPATVTRAGQPALSAWIEGAASHIGVEAEPLEAPYNEVDAMLRGVGPALLAVSAEEGPARLVCLLRRSRRRGRKSVEVLGPDLAQHTITVETLRTALCRDLDRRALPALEPMLDRCQVRRRDRDAIRRSMLGQLLAGTTIGGCWALREPPGAPFLSQIVRHGLHWQLATFVVAQVLHVAAVVLAWYLVGKSALSGQIDREWLLAWGLLLLTMVPIKLTMSWTEGCFVVGVGQLLKQRLLAGALHLRPSEIRHQGAGQLLGRVVESNALGSLALGASLTSLAALIELIAAASVLAVGAGGATHMLLLLLWVGLTVALGIRYGRRFSRWTQWRLAMTHDLVERMVGHRTRLAQETRARWHQGEDEAIDQYLGLSRQLDGTMVRLTLLLSHGWLLAGVAALGPAFVDGHSLGSLAVGLGGVILASQALATMTGALSSLTGAVVAWQQARPLFRAASRQRSGPPPELCRQHFSADNEAAPWGPGSVVEASKVVYRFRDRGEAVLRGCSIAIRDGDQLLLEGPSGGGKSTLVSILTGLREPESGLVLLHGLDRQTLGEEGWRRIVATAPQFQENYVLTGTLAFNLLMGRRWPPTAEDLRDAEEVCRELGLGDLLEQMPAGLMQIVGETGWRLSHGEQSRLFIARALLQGAELVILDESFAALDPENLHRALSCARKRAAALLVVAHP